jgi:LDH2 family malate/lactate/ureidoglycolate dehydrogenase
MTTRIPVSALTELYLAVARHFGAGEEEAKLFADARITADLRGRDTQGAATLEMELAGLASGAIRFGAELRVVKEGAAFLVVDAGHGVGEVVASRAMDLAIERAKAAGLGAVWLRNTNDFFAASSYAVRALPRGCVGIAMSNSPPFVSAWGGREPILGTNPVAIAIPGGHEPPLVIDMSSSSLSHGKVVMAAREGRFLDDAILVDDDGNITRDPTFSVVDPNDRNSLQRGSILPAGAKGFNWMLLVELFTGLLSGADLSQDTTIEISEADPSRIGQFFLAVDVATVADLDRFKAQADRLCRSIVASTPAVGFGAVTAPGHAAAEAVVDRSHHGIPVSDVVLRQLEGVARAVQFDLDLRAA